VVIGFIIATNVILYSIYTNDAKKKLQYFNLLMSKIDGKYNAKTVNFINYWRNRAVSYFLTLLFLGFGLGFPDTDSRMMLSNICAAFFGLFWFIWLSHKPKLKKIFHIFI
jgi:hypothetical protein